MNVYTEVGLRDLAQGLMACQAPRPGDRVTAQRIARHGGRRVSTPATDPMRADLRAAAAGDPGAARRFRQMRARPCTTVTTSTQPSGCP